MSNFQFTRPASFPPIVKNLIIINVLVFIAQMAFDNEYQLTGKLGLWPVESEQFRPYQIVTHMFTHGGFSHILFNMFGLWMFGKILENVWQAKRFLFFYLACGLGAAFTHIAVDYFQYRDLFAYTKQLTADGQVDLAFQLLQSNIGPTIGASGAVMGIFAAFAYTFPNTELYIMFIPVPIKAKWAVLGLVAIDLFGGIGKFSGDNIAHFAHLGGAVTGFILVYIWNKTNRKTLY